MKVSYVFIGGFIVWCIISSQWYLFGVKGLLTDPNYFKPHETTMAIVEILIMLLVAVLLGFGIAWSLLQTVIDKEQYTIDSLELEKNEIQSQVQDAKDQAERSEQKLTRAQQTFKEDYQVLEKQHNKMLAEREIEQNEGVQLKEELQTLRPKVQLADLELGRITLQIKQLENQITELKDSNKNLVSELEVVRNSAVRKKEPVFSDFIADQQLGATPVSERDKDDLKLISGIGPVIEKKLNKIGIFTFKQISEFSPQMIDSVTSSIKFFPDRIGRDNWIGQAAALARHKK